jgi:BTB/POZ domain
VPWFNDGNIILEAELSQFRVYHGILSAHSIIFKDMFNLAQPSEGENVGSCLVVDLSDCAQDIHIILEVLHNSIHRYYNSDSLKGMILLRH